MRRRFLFLSIAVGLVLLLSNFFSRPFVSFLTVIDILRNGSGPLAWLYPDVARKDLSITSNNMVLQADLYRLSNSDSSVKRPGLLVIHGLTEKGKGDPHLVNFSKTMARAGFVVLVPDLHSLKTFRVRKDSVDSATLGFKYLVEELPMVRKEKSGILGISFGGSIGLLAALDMRIRDRVNYVISFGGYYDLANVVRFYTTGGYEFGAVKEQGRPALWAKWYLILKNLDFLANSEDRKIIDTIARKKFRDESAEVKESISRLSSEGRAVYNLLVTSEFENFPAHYRKLPPRVLKIFRDLSLSGQMEEVKAEVILAHGVPDHVIPHTESLRIADALGKRSDAHVKLLRLFHHTESAALDESAQSLDLWEKIRQVWKLYTLVDRILKKAKM